MKCPYCRVDDDRVIDTRTSKDGFSIRRKRLCQSCSRRFTTHERVEEMLIKVVKKDGVRVPFAREKIKHGIEKACWKRPIADSQIEAVLDEIETEIYTNLDTEVDSHVIGESVMRHLRELDQVAYVRFASVYRDFRDVRDFVDELAPILEESERPPRED